MQIRSKFTRHTFWWNQSSSLLLLAFSVAKFSFSIGGRTSTRFRSGRLAVDRLGRISDLLVDGTEVFAESSFRLVILAGRFGVVLRDDSELEDNPN